MEVYRYYEEPSVIVEIAWADNYAEPFPAWTDITDRVEGFSTRLGRSAEIGDIEAAEVTLTLDNSDGAFTPGNVNSPYYPNVKPRRQVRIRDEAAPIPYTGPVLTNEVLNPNLQGDSGSCGLTINNPGAHASGVDDFGLQIGLGYSVFLGDTDIDAHQLDGSRFPCVAGDNVSATFSGAWTNNDSGVSEPSAEAVVEIEWFDAGSVSLGVVSGSIALAPAGAVLWPSIENAVAPANAVSYRMTFGVRGLTDPASYAYHYRLACYNHGQSAFDWYSGSSTGVGWFCGDGQILVDEDRYNFAWDGIPNVSRSSAYKLPEPDGLIGRGYIEDWSVGFDSLSGGDLSVPVTDWSADFGERPLQEVLDYEFTRRQPIDLFKFNEGSESDEFVSAVNPTRKATQRPSYNPKNSIYENQSKPVSTIRGGNEPLLPGAFGGTSIRPTDQEIVNISGTDYYLASALKVDIPEIRLTESFSFMFLYKYYANYNGFEPLAFLLKNSSRELHEDYEIYFTPDEGGAGGFRKIIVRDGDGNRWHQAFGLDTGETVACGFSWDGTTRVDRVLYQVPSATSEAIPRGQWWNDTLTESKSLDEILPAEFVFNRLEILGHSGKVIAGYADHAMQYLARWDTALTSAEMQHITRTLGSLDTQTVDERMHYVLDMIGWPRALRRIAFSKTVVPAPAWEDGANALEEMRKWARSANSPLFVDSGGLVRLDDRHDRTRAIATAPAWTFDHNDGTGVERGFMFRMADDDIVNAADVKNAERLDVRIANEASRTEYGTKVKSYDLDLADDRDAIQFGYHMVNRYGEPRVRIDSVTFYPSASAYGTLWEHAVGVTISQRIRLAGLPDNAPATSMDFFVESVAHNVIRDGDKLKWSVTLNLSPADISEGWILGDATYGVLGSTSKLIY